MNKPAPFSVRQMEYFQRCFSNWFNVAEGGKRGGKNVLQVMAFCTLLETHKNKIHLVAGVSVATAKLNILDCDGYGLLNYLRDAAGKGSIKTVIAFMCKRKPERRLCWCRAAGKMGMRS